MTFLTKKSMDRRTLLRGMGASVALPFLDAMMPSLTAQSKVAAPPRLGFVYAAHGVIFDDWKPKATGRNWELTTNLQPFAKLKNDINVLTNLSHLEIGRAHV